MSSESDLLFLAKICEQSQRFEDMLDYMKKVVNLKGPFSPQVRNSLSVAYKNSISSRRSAWRVLESLEKKENNKNQARHVELIREYKKTVQTQLINICNDLISLIDQTLLPNASGQAETQVFIHKMKADYYRYMSQVCSGDSQTQAVNNAHAAYKAATQKAQKELKTTHPVRLGLSLNFSVFYYEAMNNPAEACSLAKQTFDSAIADIDQIQQDQYKDSTTIMQLIRDNLTLWTNELEQQKE